MKLRGYKFFVAWFALTIVVAIGEWLGDLTFAYFTGRLPLDASHRSFMEAGLLALVILLTFSVYGDKMHEHS